MKANFKMNEESENNVAKDINNEENTNVEANSIVTSGISVKLPEVYEQPIEVIEKSDEPSMLSILFEAWYLQNGFQFGNMSSYFQLDDAKSHSTLADLFPQWLIWKRDYTSVSGNTIKDYTFTWKYFLENDNIINVPIADLRVKDFVNLFRKLTKDRSTTKKRFMGLKSLLNGIFDYAVEEEIVERNIVRDINCKQFTFKPVNNTKDVFTIEERKKILDYLKDNNDIYALAIRLNFHLVLRISELLALKWSDIEGNNIRIQSQMIYQYELNDDLSFSKGKFVNVDYIKGAKDEGFRYQALTPKAQEILKELRKNNWRGKYIFMKYGKQLRTEVFNEYLYRYCNDLGIKERSSHTIRFTVASILYEKGIPATVLQTMLGHTTLAMTLHYLRKVKPHDETANIMRDILDGDA